MTDKSANNEPSNLASTRSSEDQSANEILQGNEHLLRSAEFVETETIDGSEKMETVGKDTSESNEQERVVEETIDDRVILTAKTKENVEASGGKIARDGDTDGSNYPKESLKLRTTPRTRGRSQKFQQLIGKQGLRTEELEKREGDLRQRLDILECSMPAVMVWNILRMTQGSPVPNLHRTFEKQLRSAADMCCPKSPSRHYDCRVREAEAERKLAQKRAEEARALWAERESTLVQRRRKLDVARKAQDEHKEKLRQLTKEAEELRKTLEGVEKDGFCVTGECGDIRCRETWVNKASSLSSIKSADVECLEKLQELAEAELAMKRQIASLEQREEAYMRTLQQADDLWAKIEGDTASSVGALQEQLETKTATNQQMADRICELEDQLEKMRTRMASCETELEKFTSVEKIETTTGRDDDVATVSDKATAVAVRVAHRVIGEEDGFADIVDKESLAKHEIADKETLARVHLVDADAEADVIRVDQSIGAKADVADRGVDRQADLVDTGDSKVATQVKDAAYEAQKQAELQKYFAMLGSLDELNDDDDYAACDPDFVCNDEVVTATGMTDEELAEVEKKTPTVIEMETKAEQKHLRHIEESPSMKDKVLKIQQVPVTMKDEQKGAISIPEEPVVNEKDGQPVVLENEEKDEMIQEKSVVMKDKGEVETVEIESTIQPALHIAPVIIDKSINYDPKDEIRAIQKDAGEDEINEEDDSITVKDKVHTQVEVGLLRTIPEPVETDVVIPKKDLEKWVATVHSLRITVARCSTCRSMKNEAENLCKSIAAYVGIDVKETASTPLVPVLASPKQPAEVTKVEQEVGEIIEISPDTEGSVEQTLNIEKQAQEIDTVSDLTGKVAEQKGAEVSVKLIDTDKDIAVSDSPPTSIPDSKIVTKYPEDDSQHPELIIAEHPTEPSSTPIRGEAEDSTPILVPDEVARKLQAEFPTEEARREIPAEKKVAETPAIDITVVQVDKPVEDDRNIPLLEDKSDQPPGVDLKEARREEEMPPEEPLSDEIVDAAKMKEKIEKVDREAKAEPGEELPSSVKEHLQEIEEEDETLEQLEVIRLKKDIRDETKDRLDRIPKEEREVVDIQEKPISREDREIAQPLPLTGPVPEIVHETTPDEIIPSVLEPTRDKLDEQEKLTKITLSEKEDIPSPETTEISTPDGKKELLLPEERIKVTVSDKIIPTKEVTDKILPMKEPELERIVGKQETFRPTEEKAMVPDYRSIARPYLAVADIEEDTVVPAISPPSVPCICNIHICPPKQTTVISKQVEVATVEITKTEVVQTEITQPEVVHTITQTVISTATRKIPADVTPTPADTSRQKQAIAAQEPKISARKTRWRKRLRDQTSVSTATAGSQTDKVIADRSCMERRARKLPGRRIFDIPESAEFRAGSSRDTEREIRSITYVGKSDEMEKLKCNCCLCGKATSPMKLPLLRKLAMRNLSNPRSAVSPLSTSRSPMASLSSKDQKSQDSQVCPECRIRERMFKQIEDRRNQFRDKPKAQADVKKMCDAEVDTWTPSGSKAKARSTSRRKPTTEMKDQSCSAKVTVPKTNTDEHKKVDDLDATSNRTIKNSAMSSSIGTIAKKSYDFSDCICVQTDDSKSDHSTTTDMSQCICGDSD